MSEDKPNLKELLIYITQIEDKRQISQIYVSLKEYIKKTFVDYYLFIVSIIVKIIVDKNIILCYNIFEVKGKENKNP